ncbi:HAMP domain-containing protein [Oxalobacteraceae bacterium CAVE-383]|nr:HAMP domain-containing protein [Oxalobacteraceae bacterium CAVE-383]
MGRLFWKFFFFILLAQITATVGIGSILWLEARSHERTHSDIDDSPPAAFRVEAAAATLHFGGVDALRQLLTQQRRRAVYAVDEHEHELLNRPVPATALTQARGLLPRTPAVVQEVPSPDGHRYLLFQAPLEGFDGKNHIDGEQTLRIFEGRSRYITTAPSRELIPFLPLLAAIFASLIFAFLLAWYFAQPIRHLKQAFDAASEGNLDRRLTVAMGGRRDELSDLGRDFDHMTQKLRALMNSQRRLLHDVSHELRSPLARLQASIGLALQQPEKMHESLQRIAREGGRIDKLVSELLTLSKLETGVMHTRIEAIDMQDLLGGIIEDAQFEASAKDCNVVWRGRVTSLVNGDPELLQRALENVLRNAVKYSPAGNEITLTTQLDEATRELTVSILDQGPGVPESELKLIFEPFYRGSNTNTAGHGLGLAIAIRIVEAHGGGIGAANREQGGLQIDIRLPVSATITQ